MIFENLPKRNFLLLHDAVPTTEHGKHVHYFDAKKHSFQLPKRIDYHYACDFVEVLAALFPGGESTLTRQSGLILLLEALLNKPKSLRTLIEKPSSKSSPGHVWAYNAMQRVFLSPVLSRVLSPSDFPFSFNPESVIVAAIDRTELRDFDARALGLFLLMHFKGQVVVPDLGFYGRDTHVSLIHEQRLIASVRYLDEVKRTAPQLREALLSISDIEAHGARFTDARELAINAGLRPDPQHDDNAYNRYITEAIAR